MISRLTRFFALTLSLSLGGICLSACSDDPGNGNTTTATTGSGSAHPTGTANNNPTNNPTGAATNNNPTGTATNNPAPACDPKGPNPAMGDLLNKPLDPKVMVLKKKPTHPGNPGPAGLP